MSDIASAHEAAVVAHMAAVPDDLTATGSRREFTARVRALVEGAGERVREEFAEPDTVALYCKAIRAGIVARDRTALNLYAQIMKLVGEERRITVEFIHSLGARSEKELRDYVEAAKSVEGAGPHEGAARCVDYLEAYLNLNPGQRESVVRRLGGLVPVG